MRKQRTRAANKSSSLQRSVSAADLEAGSGEASTRPHSPTGSSVDLDGNGNHADWTFAKREHALARLGLDPALDNLPDEELNRLFEKITKVKTMREIGRAHV